MKGRHNRIPVLPYLCGRKPRNSAAPQPLGIPKGAACYRRDARIQTDLIAFGLHEFCRQNYNQTAKRMEISIILTVALAAALIVVVLALVAVIIYQRWRLSDKNAAISKFINENEQLRQKMQRKGIV